MIMWNVRSRFHATRLIFTQTAHYPTACKTLIGVGFDINFTHTYYRPGFSCSRTSLLLILITVCAGQQKKQKKRGAPPFIPIFNLNCSCLVPPPSCFFFNYVSKTSFRLLCLFTWSLESILFWRIFGAELYFADLAKEKPFYF